MTKQQLITKTANEVLKKMNSESKKDLLKYKPIELHFFLGMTIRNQFIYGNEEFDDYEPDEISQEIIEEMQKIVRKEKK